MSSEGVTAASAAGGVAAAVDVTHGETASDSDGDDDSGFPAADDEGSLRFLWAPRRMDGKPLALAAGDEGGGDGDGGEEQVLTYALLHHRQAFFSSDDGLTDVGTPTLHGQVGFLLAVGGVGGEEGCFDEGSSGGGREHAKGFWTGRKTVQ